MANGSTHRKINTWIGFPLGIFILLYLKMTVEFYFYFTLFFFVNTLFLNPDLDIINFRKKPYHLLPLFLLFYPYAWFSKHRGVSHIPVVGTFARTCYLLLLILPFYFFQNGFNVDFIVKGDFIFLTFFGFVTFIYADFLHLIGDRF